MNRNISAVILVALSAGIYFTLTSSLIDSTQAIRKVNIEYASALTHASQLTEARDELLKQFAAISDSDRARLNKMIPGSVDNIRLVIDLNSLALRHGFSLTGIKATVAADANRAAGTSQPSLSAMVGSASSIAQSAASIASPVLDNVAISFGASAGYDQFISFLQDVESNLRIMDLTHLSLTPAPGGLYNFDVQFQTYWLRQ